MRLIFMGTPDFAATILEDLVEQHEVCAVYTRPDAIRGRGTHAVASPVKDLALSKGLIVKTPQTLQDPLVQEELRAFNAEVICVAAYGALLPKEVLEIPPYGCLNVHASLLPLWRGAAPIERAILAGERETGVCIMRMEEGLDTGDYCICRTATIEEKTAEELSDELANLGSHALLTALIHLQNNASDWIKQKESHATYAPKIEKGELNIRPEESALKAVLKVRASSPAHPSRCVVAGKNVSMIEIKEIRGDLHAQELCTDILPGQVRFVEKRLFFGTGESAFEVLSLKPDGKQRMNANAFASGVQNIKQDQIIWESLHGA